MNELHKSFSVEPKFILKDDNTGEIEDTDKVLSLLRNDLVTITEMAEWILRDDKKLLEDLAKFDGKNLKSAKIGETLGIRIPEEIKGRRVVGGSRFETLVLERAISEAKSWRERSLAQKGKSTKYVSQGWKRTADYTMPTDLSPKVNLGAVNAQYASFVSISHEDREIILRLVVNRQWYRFIFPFPKRFHDSEKVCLPSIRISKDGRIVFDFAVAYPPNFAQFSDRYIVGVDVGINNYATVVVWDLKKKRISHQTTLSQRVHSLANSIKASERQKRSLWKQSLTKESRLHREAASRKKRELAIIAGQEIANIAHDFGNAIVVFEDLSWISNTMQNGRWNRGELVKRTREFVELNGSRMFKVNAAGTSTRCHVCHVKGFFVKYSDFHCSSCGMVMDRDVNAGANIAQRAYSLLVKSIKSRSKSKRLLNKPIKRSAMVRYSLKYPRCKNKPTPKRRRRCGKVSNVPRIPEHAGTVYAVVRESKSLIKTQKAGRINTNAKEILHSIKTLE